VEDSTETLGAILSMVPLSIATLPDLVWTPQGYLSILHPAWVIRWKHIIHSTNPSTQSHIPHIQLENTLWHFVHVKRAFVKM
jgi:hypothetical protein